jgi:predicted amidophosphoribosyltransferase
MKVLCSTCDLPLPCTNFWCRREDRGFDVVWAVGVHEGELRRAIAELKYRGESWRAGQLGRLVAAFLLEHAPWFEDVDLIVGVPGYGERDHVRRVLAAAAPLIGALWEVDAADSVLVKTAPTRPLTGTRSAPARRLRAAGELRSALAVARPGAVRGARLLVVDDVFTDGSTMREVALALRSAGAVRVSGLVVARRPRSHLLP